MTTALVKINFTNQDGVENVSCLKKSIYYSLEWSGVVIKVLFIALLIPYLLNDDNDYQYKFKEMAIALLVFYCIFLILSIFEKVGKDIAEKIKLEMISSILGVGFYLFSIAHYVIWHLQDESQDSDLYDLIGGLLIFEVIILSGLILLCCCCIGCASCLTCIAGYNEIEHRNQRRATISMINSVTGTSIFSKYMESLDKKVDEKDCCICQEKFQGKDEIRTLGCNHYYHKGCIDKWLKKDKSCPICRKDIDQESV